MPLLLVSICLTLLVTASRQSGGDFGCVSDAFITCSVNKGTAKSSDLKTREAGTEVVSYTVVESEYPRCPRSFYDCLRKREPTCPLVRKFTANLQAVCEPERRKFISEFQLCANRAEEECGTSLDDPEDPDAEQLDAMSLQTLLDAKCDSIKKRHKCNHEVMAREDCAEEVANYFESQIESDMKAASLNGSLCRLVPSLTFEEHRRANLAPGVMGYNDDPNSAKTDQVAVSLTGDDGKASEVPNALKRELKSNPRSGMDALSSSGAPGPSLAPLAIATGFLFWRLTCGK